MAKLRESSLGGLPLVRSRAVDMKMGTRFADGSNAERTDAVPGGQDLHVQLRSTI